MKKSTQQQLALQQFFQALMTRMFKYGELSLTPRESKIMCDVLTGKSFAEIGEAQHLRSERVRQIWNKAVHKWSMSKTLLERKDEEIKHLQAKVNMLLYGLDSQEASVLLGTPLAACDFSVRLLSCLKAAGLETVRDLVKLKRIDLLKVRNFGKKSLTELDEWLDAHGLCFAENN